MRLEGKVALTTGGGTRHRGSGRVLSDFSTQLMNKHCLHSINFSNVVRQNFFAKYKEVTDKDPTRHRDSR